MDAAREIVDAMATLPIEVDSGVPPAARQLLELAMRYNLSSHASGCGGAVTIRSANPAIHPGAMRSGFRPLIPRAPT